jgi:hypothetical protein
MNKTLSLLKRPHQLIVTIHRRVFCWLPDKTFLSILNFLIFGKKMNWEKPQTFNEKLTWIKLYDRRPEYTKMADKYSVKKLVSDRIGKEYVVENYVVADRWEDIDFDKLPNQFVIKCTHDSGGAFICRDKKTFDYDKVRKRIERNLKMRNWKTGREWPYKDIPHRIIVDRLLDDHTGNELRDYKFWCFNGVPTYMYCTIKAANIYENFYDMDFQPVNIDHGFPRHQPEFEKPTNFELMKDLASKLSKGIPFLRVDFFDVEGKVYFGEFTFYDWGGTRPFRGNWDNYLGQFIKLPTDKH